MRPRRDYAVGDLFGKECQLEVVAVLGRSATKREIEYSVVCHKCKADPELFGDGKFIMIGSYLSRGSYVCGCAKSVRWSKEQWLVKIGRECIARNYVFKGFVGEWAGSYTNLHLKCNTCGHEWNTLTLAGFVNSGVGCSKCAARTRGKHLVKTCHETIQKFVSSGKFLEGTEFQKIGTGLWSYTCPRCSGDEYVAAGVCDGIFFARHGNLSQGTLSCRCSQAFKWTTAQREYQVRKAAAELGSSYRFVEWQGAGYKNQDSRVVLSCDEHGPWDVSITGVLFQKHGCPKCAEYGFNRQTPSGLYILKVEGRCGFTGFGISNTPDSRLSRHKRNLANAGFTIGQTQIFHMTGQQAWDVEQLLKKTFPLNPQDVEGFRTEATYYEHYQAVCDFVDKWIFDNAQDSY